MEPNGLHFVPTENQESAKEEKNMEQKFRCSSSSIICVKRHLKNIQWYMPECQSICINWALCAESKSSIFMRFPQFLFWPHTEKVNPIFYYYFLNWIKTQNRVRRSVTETKFTIFAAKNGKFYLLLLIPICGDELSEGEKLQIHFRQFVPVSAAIATRTATKINHYLSLFNDQWSFSFIERSYLKFLKCFLPAYSEFVIEFVHWQKLVVCFQCRLQQCNTMSNAMSYIVDSHRSKKLTRIKIKREPLHSTRSFHN